MREFLLLILTLPLLAQTKHINPAGLAKPRMYSHVVATRPQEIIYVSGQVALDASGKLVGKGDLVAQTTQVFENLKLH